jgi:hypothetical protein
MNVFEKFHADQPSFDGVLFVQWPPTGGGVYVNKVVLLLASGRGHDILAITADGQMHFAPGYTPNQQAEAFRQAMNIASQHCVFPLVPPPALDEISTTQSADGTYYVDTPSPTATLHDIVELHYGQQENRPTDPNRKDVPHPDKLL